MNDTDDMTNNCTLVVPAPLLWVALVHCYCVIVFGTMGNALAMWCVAQCTRTRRPIKVLLFSVFLPVLVVSLATHPITGKDWTDHLTCAPDSISNTVFIIAGVTTGILVQIERTSIVIIAVVRAAAIWAPHWPKLGIRSAVMLVVLTCVYAILSNLALTSSATYGLAIPVVVSQVTPPLAVTASFFFFTVTLPVLITAAAYILIIYVIQRNMRCLVVYQQQASVTTTMDQATRAMLAVFISNLLFGLPCTIYHLKSKQSRFTYIIFKMILSTHFVMDPLAYMWFTSGYRETVLSLIRNVIQFMSSSSITQSVIQTGSTFSCNQQEQHKSRHMQKEDCNL